MIKEKYYYWPTDMLARRIANHHREMREKLTEIKATFAQLASAYGAMHPELHVANLLLLQGIREIETHFSKESMTVLAFAKRYTKELKKQKELRKPGLYSACPSIHKMYLEHKQENHRFILLFNLMDRVSISDKDSFLYETACQKSNELISHWNKLVQLENDVLFPKIIEMESTLDPL
jgi:regulator of cell morphogenesis and NO signaling